MPNHTIPPGDLDAELEELRLQLPERPAQEPVDESLMVTLNYAEWSELCADLEHWLARMRRPD
jgi:hypothetical protein